QDLLGTGCNGNLVQRVVYAVLDRELLSNSLLQLKGAVEWGVLGVASINSGFGGRLDMVRRVEVRLTRAKHDDGMAIPFHRICTRTDLQDLRYTDSGYPQGRAEGGYWVLWGN